uniref:Cilia and flagella associated protein 100 n=1 Tax=Lepisosteus oculatus TaxID=7918 RepID=W5N8F0_LEPOC
IISEKLSAIIPEDDNQVNKNPFKLPADNDIFLLRDKERERMKLVREQQKKLKIHEKTTYAGRMNTKRVETRRAMKEGEEMTMDTSTYKIISNSPINRQVLLKYRNIERESINEFISKKREMFLLQYSLAVKRDEIRKLDEVAAAEESKLEKAEQFLEDDAAMFDEFLKENDKNSVEAIKILSSAEQEAKVKLEKVAEKKRLSAKIVSIKSDISKYEDILKEYMTYKEFLLKLSPKEWQQKYEEKHRKNKQARAELKNKENESEQACSCHSACVREKKKRMDSRSSNVTQQGGREVTSVRDSRMSSRHSLKPSSSSRKLSSRSQIDEDNSSDDDDEEPELYFTEPQQLLDILTELEEQNLSLIQNSRETEEALEEFKHTMVNTQKKMDQETEILKQQIDILKQTIEREKERAAELELKARLFSFGQYKSEDQHTYCMLYNDVVTRVSLCSFFGNSKLNRANIQSVSAFPSSSYDIQYMYSRTAISQQYLSVLSINTTNFILLREEKIKMQKQHQEERLRKALERAQVDIKKPAGKRLMFRSQPPARKVKENKDQDITDKEKEEQLYFFT